MSKVNTGPRMERRDTMTDRKLWFITGAARGMGVEFAKAALAAGHAVVATGRRTDAVTQAVGESDDLLVVKLDVTSLADAQAAARAAVDRFGRIDVLVNNAANFYAGYFEELTPEEIERQLATSVPRALVVFGIRRRRVRRRDPNHWKKRSTSS